MTPGEAVAFGFATAYAGGWLFLLFLLSKLYEWDYPAPFWRAIERAWDQIVRGVSWAIEGLIGGLLWVFRAVL